MCISCIYVYAVNLIRGIFHPQNKKMYLHKYLISEVYPINLIRYTLFHKSPYFHKLIYFQIHSSILHYNPD